MPYVTIGLRPTVTLKILKFDLFFLNFDKFLEISGSQRVNQTGVGI